MARIANRRIPPNMYTSYTVPDFSYAKYIKDGRLEYGGAKSCLVRIGQAGGRVTPDPP